MYNDAVGAVLSARQPYRTSYINSLYINCNLNNNLNWYYIKVAIYQL